MKAVRVGGTIAQIGVLSGTETKLSVVPILMRQIRLIGIYVGSRTMMEEMTRAMERSQLKPTVGKTFPFLDTVGAFRYLENGNHFGKIVISLEAND